MTAFTPTHRTPPSGLSTWDAPDTTSPEGPRLVPDLEVQLIQRWGDWAEIVCTNGWTTWVDGRSLVAAEPAVVKPTVSVPQPRVSPPPITARRSPVSPVFPVPPIDVAREPPLRIRGISISVGLVGGALIALSSLFPWVSTATTMKVPVAVLWNYKTQSNSGLKIGWLTLVLGIAAVTGCVRPLPAQLMKAIGWAAVLVPTLLVAQLQRSVGQPEVGAVFRVVGLGVYGTIAGGLAVALAKPPATDSSKRE